MKLEVSNNQVMQKCNYCYASNWNGECPFLNGTERKFDACMDALKLMIAVKKGGAE